MNESLALARNITDTDYADIPSRVIEVTKKSILDALGVTLAASTLGDGCKAFVDYAIAYGGKKTSTIIGFDARTSAPMAAFANGAMAHALDFEDAHDGALMHPNAATIPGALAIAEALGNVSGKQLLTAITLGSDLVCRLGMGLNVNPLELGWYIPPIFGAFGATAAVAKLLRLSQEQIVDAFSLTLGQATFSAAISSTPRSVIRSVRDAFSAQAGLAAALLAQNGTAGFDEPFEGPAGLFQLYAHGNYDRVALTRELGKTFAGGDVGFKPWPSCRGTHGYIGAALEILRDRPMASREIEAIDVVVSPVNKMLCDPLERKRNPGMGIDAKFSIPFAVATALRFGGVTLDHFSREALTDRETLELTRRVSYRVDPQLSLRQAAEGSLSIKTRTGTLEKKLGNVLGSVENPISQAALISKFMDCARYAANKIPQERLNELVDMILNLERIENVGELTVILCSSHKD